MLQEETDEYQMSARGGAVQDYLLQPLLIQQSGMTIIQYSIVFHQFLEKFLSLPVFRVDGQ